MAFLYPNFLWALLLLIVPIIIHLFYFRRFKTIYFTNVRHLRAIKKESQYKNRLKHLLVLLSRMLFIAAAVLAFAQPYIPDDEIGQMAGAEKHISIYVDNSFSMLNKSESGSLIEEAVSRAKAVMNGYGDRDKFQILTNDFEGRHQRFYTKEEAEKILDEVLETPIIRDFNSIYKRQQDAFSNTNAEVKHAFIVSDFQASTMQLERAEEPDTLINYAFVPIASGSEDNIYVDSVWFESPIFQLGKSQKINITVQNLGAEDLEDVPVTLEINGAQKGIANIQLKAGEKTTTGINYTVSDTGWNKGVVSVEDYPVTFDNSYYFSFPVQAAYEVLHVYQNRPNRFLRVLFDEETYFQTDYRAVDDVNYGRLNQYDFLVLDEPESLSSGAIAAYGDYVENGGNLLIIPPQADAPRHLNELLSRLQAAPYAEKKDQLDFRLKELDTDLPFFYDVLEEVAEKINMPKVLKYYQIESQNRRLEQQLFALENGSSILSHYPYQSGHVFVSTIAFQEEWTGLMRHALFLPAVYKMAMYGGGMGNIAFTIGDESVIEVMLPETFTDPILRLAQGENNIIPPQNKAGSKMKIYPDEVIHEAGFYELKGGSEGNKGDFTEVFAFNYNRAESDLAAYSKEDLAKNAEFLNTRIMDVAGEKLSAEVSAVFEMTTLWRLFLSLALLFLIVEVLLIRLLK